MKKMWISLLLLLALPAGFGLAGCGGGGGGSAPDGFADGDWVASEMYGNSIYNNGSNTYDFVRFDQIEFTLFDNAIEGTAVVNEVDADGVIANANGQSAGGWTVGESVSIFGSLRGTEVMIIAENGGGAEFQIIAAPFDGDLRTSSGGRELVAAETLSGAAQTNGSGHQPGDDSYIEDLELIGGFSRSPLPQRVTLGSGNSVYRDGAWTGSTDCFETRRGSATAAGSSDSIIEFDLDLTFSGNTVSGMATLTGIDTEPDWNGFQPGDTFTITGEIRGTYIEMFLASGSFTKRIDAVRTPNRPPGTAPLGDETSLDSEYPPSSDTSDFYAAACEVDIAWDSI